MFIRYMTLPGKGVGIVTIGACAQLQYNGYWNGSMDKNGALVRERRYASDCEWILPGTYGYDGEPVDKTQLHFGEDGVLLDGPEMLLRQQAYEAGRRRVRV